MDVDGARIKASPTDYEYRATPDGKTSSVHWLRFAFTPEQIAKFKSSEGRVVIEIAHPNYGHMAIYSAPKCARSWRRILGSSRTAREPADPPHFPV